MPEDKPFQVNPEEPIQVERPPNKEVLVGSWWQSKTAGHVIQVSRVDNHKVWTTYSDGVVCPVLRGDFFRVFSLMSSPTPERIK